MWGGGRDEGGGRGLAIASSRCSRRSLSSVQVSTVEPRFKKPLYNEVLGITNDILQPGQSYSKMYGTEARYNEILVIANTIEKTKRKIYPDNKR